MRIHEAIDMGNDNFMKLLSMFTDRKSLLTLQVVRPESEVESAHFQDCGMKFSFGRSGRLVYASPRRPRCDLRGSHFCKIEPIDTFQVMECVQVRSWGVDRCATHASRNN